MIQIRIAMAAIPLAVASHAWGQQLAAQCPDLGRTLKEYTIDSSSSSFVNAVFTQHCQLDGSRKSGGGGLGIEAVVQSIPAKFTGNYTSAEDRMTSFCKTYSGQYQATAAADSYKETISAKALETVQQCFALAATGINVSSKVSNVEAADFYLKNSVTSTFDLQGVQVAGNVQCEGLVDGRKKTFDASLGMKITKTVSFACKRTGTPTPSGGTSYGEAIVTVLTNQGNYTLFWPKDERQSENMATAIDARISALASEMAVAKANLSPLVTAVSAPVYKCPQGVTESRDAKWMYVGCNGQYSTQSTCVNSWTDRGETRACEPAGTLKLFK